MRPQGMAPVARRFATALASDPRTAQRFERIDGMLPMRMVWRRRDLARPTADERSARIEQAMRQFPSYATELAKSLER